jgi:hypothetical protein
MQIALDLLNLFVSIKSEIAIASDKIIKHHQHVEQENARLLAEESNLQNTNLDKLVPFANDDNDGWDLNCRVTIQMYKPTSSADDIFTSVESNFPFSRIADLVKLDLRLKLMKKPFGQGTFRYAYYGFDPVSNQKVYSHFLIFQYAVKHFKGDQGIDEYECASKTNKAYFLCSLAASAFTKELLNIGINARVDYVPSYHGWIVDGQNPTVFDGKVCARVDG